MHRYLRIRLVTMLAAATFAFAGCGSNGDVGASTETVTQGGSAHSALDSGALNEALETVLDEYEVPGAVVDLRTPQGSWRVTTGVTDLETGDEVSDDLLWPLRSVTRSIVTTVVAELADEGVLDLEEPVANYLDSVPEGDKITLRMLADMTSGVGDYSQSEQLFDAFANDPSQDFTLEGLNEMGFAEGPAFEPGAERVYSNTAPNVLARVIEEVTGDDIARVIDERITTELGLTNTWYPETADDWPGPHPRGYQPDEGVLTESFNNFTAMAASGAMVSDIEDMAVWAEALGSGALLSPEAHAQRLEGGPLSAGPEYDKYAMGIGEISGWWGHTGEGLGFTSLVAYDPDTASTLVIFMNVSQALDSEGNERHAPTVLLREIAAVLDT